MRAEAGSVSRSEAGAPEPLDPSLPLALVAPGAGGTRLVVLNAAAEACGLVEGELLSNARSKALDLTVRDADPAADAAALAKLGLWCLRYTPLVAAWGEDAGADGLFLDVEGSAHLFGGEASLLADLAARLALFGLRARLALASTAGASWAVAHCGTPSPLPGGERSRPRRQAGGAGEGENLQLAVAPPHPVLRTDLSPPGRGEAAKTTHSHYGLIVPTGEEASALRDLPLAALRLPEETRALLRRLGLRRIGQMMDEPRGPLTVRFGPLLLRRLDEAVGRAPEPLVPLVSPPCYQARASFLEPISSEEHVAIAARRLLGDVMDQLARDGRGARRLRLLLFRVAATTWLPRDGAVLSLDIGLAAPSRDCAHMVRLIALRLERLPQGLDADFGFEAAAVHVLVAESMAETQDVLETGDTPRAGGHGPGLAHLIDKLEHRLGSGAVRWLAPVESHIPERAEAAHAAANGPSSGWQGDGAPGSVRPLLLLPRPEAAEVTALIPEGPPRQFRWRGVAHQIVAAEGPERIAPEWWRSAPRERERDYYLVEDGNGRRFWLFRAGRYGTDGEPPRWFVHGVLA